MACSSCENGGTDHTGLGGEGFDLGLSLPAADGLLDFGSFVAGIFGKRKKKKDDDDDAIPSCPGILYYGTADGAHNWVLENCGGYGWYMAINTLVFPQEWCVACGEPPTSSPDNPGIFGADS